MTLRPFATLLSLAADIEAGADPQSTLEARDAARELDPLLQESNQGTASGALLPPIDPGMLATVALRGLALHLQLDAGAGEQP